MGSCEVSALDYLRDASGDPIALVTLAKAALTASETDGHHQLVATVEGLTFARLAAAQGDLAAFGLVVTLSAQLADLLDDMGDFDTAANMRGEALAAADIACDKVPEGSLGEVLGAYLAANEVADPDSLPQASHARRFWTGQ